jgi:hypothetical protein
MSSPSESNLAEVAAIPEAPLTPELSRNNDELDDLETIHMSSGKKNKSSKIRGDKMSPSNSPNNLVFNAGSGDSSSCDGSSSSSGSSASSSTPTSNSKASRAHNNNHSISSSSKKLLEPTSHFAPIPDHHLDEHLKNNPQDNPNYHLNPHLQKQHLQDTLAKEQPRGGLNSRESFRYFNDSLTNFPKPSDKYEFISKAVRSDADRRQNNAMASGGAALLNLADLDNLPDAMNDVSLRRALEEYSKEINLMENDGRNLVEGGGKYQKGTGGGGVGGGSLGSSVRVGSGLNLKSPKRENPLDVKTGKPKEYKSLTNEVGLDYEDLEDVKSTTSSFLDAWVVTNEFIYNLGGSGGDDAGPQPAMERGAAGKTIVGGRRGGVVPTGAGGPGGSTGAKKYYISKAQKQEELDVSARKKLEFNSDGDVRIGRLEYTKKGNSNYSRELKFK